MSIIKEIKRISLTDREEQMLKKIEDYDMQFVFYKLIVENKISISDSNELEKEFKKFIFLTGLNIYPIAMISPLIDEVWHQFILFTKHYKEFCHSSVGFFVGHMPDTPYTPIPLVAGENFRKNYVKYFGEIKDIWYKDMDDKTKEYYLLKELNGKPLRMWSGWAGPE